MSFYDESGKKIEQTIFFHGEGGLKDKLTCRYDKQGNMKLDDGVDISHIYKKNTKGKILEDKIINNPDSSLVSRTTYLYDTKGNLTEAANYDLYNDLNIKYLYKYDANGNIIESTSIVYIFNEPTQTKYKYDIKGNITEKIYSDENGTTRYTFKYDKKRNVVEMIKHDNSIQDPKLASLYAVNITTRYTYEYDNMGNWIKRTEIEDEYFAIIYEREIEYYKTTSVTDTTNIIQAQGTFTDPTDLRKYKTVTIGGQTWMAENLAAKTTSGCWVYENAEANSSKYGYLYTREAAAIACPYGWHLPNGEEFQILIKNLGGSDIAGGKMKSLLGSENNTSLSNDAVRTAFLCGHRSDNGMFYDAGIFGTWWVGGWTWKISKTSDAIFSNSPFPNYAYSVRCIKDNKGFDK